MGPELTGYPAIRETRKDSPIRNTAAADRWAGTQRGAETRAMSDDSRGRFELLVRALSGQVYRYAYWLCRDETQAKDLVQETFMRGWRSFGNLQDEHKARSWLFTTARREFLRHAVERRETCDTEPDTLPGNLGDPVAAAEIQTLRRAIAALPLRYREPLALQVIGGYTGDEIAELLGIRRNNVDQRLYRARRILRDRLSGEGPDVNKVVSTS